MNASTRTGVTARPYQLLCVVCAVGEGCAPPKNEGARLLLEAVRADPDVPVTIRSNVGGLFGYQDPGTAEDTPEGADFNLKRDFDVLQRLDIVPGSVLPARLLFTRLYDGIASVRGICGYNTVTSEAWRGCPKAKSGFYEKGHAAGITNIIPPRSSEQMAREKVKSIEALRSASEINMRPHLLLCAICQYGDGTRPPFAEDNLPEFLDMVFNQHSDIMITMVPGADWMMCAPCPWRSPALNACVTGRNCSGGLYNHLKDLYVLQVLGLTYGTKMKAREFYELALSKIPATAGGCALESSGLTPRSLWRDACGGSKEAQQRYASGRQLLLEKTKVTGRN